MSKIFSNIYNFYKRVFMKIKISSLFTSFIVIFALGFIKLAFDLGYNPLYIGQTIKFFFLYWIIKFIIRSTVDELFVINNIDYKIGDLHYTFGAEDLTKIIHPMNSEPGPSNLPENAPEKEASDKAKSKEEIKRKADKFLEDLSKEDAKSVEQVKRIKQSFLDEYASRFRKEEEPAPEPDAGDQYTEKLKIDMDELGYQSLGNSGGVYLKNHWHWGARISRIDVSDPNSQLEQGLKVDSTGKILPGVNQPFASKYANILKAIQGTEKNRLTDNMFQGNPKLKAYTAEAIKSIGGKKPVYETYISDSLIKELRK